jgi:hypothetical protein
LEAYFEISMLNDSQSSIDSQNHTQKLLLGTQASEEEKMGEA